MLLKAVWIWADAIAALLSLGLIAPAMFAFIVGMQPLAIQRRDWRTTVHLLGVLALVLVCGGFALSQVKEPAPEWSFWLALSVQLGLLVFAGVLIMTLRLSFRRRREAREALQNVSAPRSLQVTTAGLFPEPAARSRLTGIEAEYWIAEWMRHLGAEEAIVTPSRRDGGIDVLSDHYVAQVKHRPGDYISVDLVRALAGVANVKDRVPLFFSSSHYSRDALAFANTAGMALFIFRPSDGRLIGANTIASALRTRGLLGRVSRPTSEAAALVGAGA